MDPNDFRLGTIVTAQLSFKGTLDLLETLFAHRFNDPVLQKEISKFLGSCREVEKRRNQIIHSSWVPDNMKGRGALRPKSIARGSLKIQGEVLSKADLQREADTFKDLTDVLLKTWMPHIDKYRASRATPATYLPPLHDISGGPSPERSQEKTGRATRKKSR
jgi:hypothetical protein